MSSSDHVEAIVMAALSLSPGERAAYVAQACADDAALRQQVEARLRAEEQRGPAGAVFDQTVALPPPPVPRGEKPGDRLGRYKLLEKVGEGGMGTVWVAEQTEPVHRQVALKVIKLGMDTHQVIGRFEAERQALALMDHPNIARVLDAGATDTGRPYFVMELVKGIPITDYCDRHNLTTPQRLELFIQVCQAIQHAHQKGIIHRDIKPSNILITVRDGMPVPKVIDFGIAKATGGRLTEMTIHTAIAEFIGTPAYMSPEQAEMDALDVDTRSDIYSLGVLLYELLTGQTPFDSQRLVKAGVDGIRRIIREEDPLRPSTRLNTMDARQRTTVAKRRQCEAPKLIHLVKGDLDWIVMKTLEKDRTRRYETANGLAMDVRRFLRNEPIVARPPSGVYRFQKLVRRHKLEFAAGGAALTIAAVATVAFVVLILANRVKVQHQRDAALKAKAEAEQQRQRAEDALGQMEIQKAEELFGGHGAATALAYLAHVLRRDPANYVAAERLLSALTFRDLALPIADLLNPGQGASAVVFTPDGSQVITLYAEGCTRVWDARTGRLVSESPRHDAKVLRQFMTANGRWLALAMEGNTVRIRNLQTGQWQGEVIKLDEDVRSLRLTSDGRRLLTLSGGTVRLWDIPTGLLQSSLGQDDEVDAANLAPDGNTVVTLSRRSTARIWDGVAGQPKTPPLRPGSGARFYHAEFSPDSRRVIASTTDSTGIIWGVNDGDPVIELTGHRRAVFSAYFSPDRARVATGSCDSSALVWDAATGQPLFAPLVHDNHVHFVGFSRDAARVVTASLDRTARVWDAHLGCPLTEPLKHTTEVRYARFSPEGRRLVTRTPGGIARLWDIRPGHAAPRLLMHDAPLVTARFSPDGRWLLTAGGNLAQVWDPKTGLLIKLLKRDARVASACFSPDGRWAAADVSDTVALWDVNAGWESSRSLRAAVGADLRDLSRSGQRLLTTSNNVARVWEVQTGNLLAYCSHADKVGAAGFSPDGRFLITASMDKTARVWDAASGEPVTPELRHQDWVLHARFSPDGRQVVTASKDDTACLWEVPSGKQRLEPFEHKGQVVYACFSADGRQLVTCSEDRTARVWDTGTGKPIAQPLQHAGHVLFAEFSPNGRRLVTVADDQTARVWDARTGSPLSEPLKHDGRIVSVQFSPDEQQVLTASADRTARLWALPPTPLPVPAWLPALAEAVGGERLDEEKGVESVPFAVLVQLEQQLLKDAGQGFYLRWAHWFFADRETRTLSAFSASTVPEYVQQRIKGDTPEGLQEALWLSPTNGSVWAGLARKCVAPGLATNSLLRADAEWYSRRAIELAPEDPHVWLACADVRQSLARGTDPADAAPTSEGPGPKLDPDRQLEEARQFYSQVIDSATTNTHAKELLPRALLGRFAVLKILGRTADAQADFLRAKNIPPRDPHLDPNLIDLSPHYNASLDEPLHVKSNPGNNLAALPRGLQALANVQFDVRALVQLSSSRLKELDRDADYPEQVSAIRVARQCRRLHFLHASGIAVADGVQIGSYVIHYADGRQREIPIVYGESVRDWWVVNGEPPAPEQLHVAWTGSNAATPRIRLFKSTWENPLPDTEVTAIDFISKMTRAAPFLIAITAE